MTKTMMDAIKREAVSVFARSYEQQRERFWQRNPQEGATLGEEDAEEMALEAGYDAEDFEKRAIDWFKQ